MKNLDYKTEVMGIVGFTVAALQRAEDTFALCWLAFSRKENIDGVDCFVLDDDMEDIFHKNRKKTLGQLFSDIKRSAHFNKSFEKRFQRFLKDRNRLIHRIFKEPAYRTLNNKRSLERLHRFTSKLFSESMYFTEIFDTYLGMMFELLHNQEGWKVDGIEYVLELNESRRKNGMFTELFSYINKVEQRGAVGEP
jgi:hypothetical protein